jgi:hypothetical protein
VSISYWQLTQFWVWVLCYDRRSAGQSCLGIKHPSGALEQIFITVRQLQACWCGALSLTRRQVCRLQLLLAIASAVILRSESGGTRTHILLSQIRDFPFHHHLRLAGLRWMYSTPPPYGINSILTLVLSYIVSTRTTKHRKHSPSIAVEVCFHAVA